MQPSPTPNINYGNPAILATSTRAMTRETAFQPKQNNLPYSSSSLHGIES